MTCRCRSILLNVSLCATLLGSQAPGALSQSGACLTAEPRASAFIAGVRHMYSLAGADSLRWKAHVPFASGSAIALVTDNATCVLAVAAYNKASGRAGTTYATTKVYVAKIGATGYVVTTTQGATGEWTSHYTFDKRWRLVPGIIYDG